MQTMQFELDKTYKCYKCNEDLQFEVKIGRRDQCLNCGAYLHCCYNCKHWDLTAPNQCREAPKEHVTDRSEGNFCLYFTFIPPEEDVSTEMDAAKAKLEAAFGKSKGLQRSSEAQDPKARLEALFKKK